MNFQERIDDLNQTIPNWARDRLEKLMVELGLLNPMEDVQTPEQIQALRTKIWGIIYRVREVIDRRQSVQAQICEQEDARIVQIMATIAPET